VACKRYLFGFSLDQRSLGILKNSVQDVIVLIRVLMIGLKFAFDYLERLILIRIQSNSAVDRLRVNEFTRSKLIQASLSLFPD
jgi:hypothetical protein